jgi:uncharacterized protein YdhG (YjbR/CyaY superfamily)
MKTAKPADINAYIAGFPYQVQKSLELVRKTVKQAAPGAKETIKYNMPAFTMGKNLVYFAGYKNHIGFYPAPTDDPDYTNDFAGYHTGKGSVQFPLDKPMPVDLIIKIVNWRIKRLNG